MPLEDSLCTRILSHFCGMREGTHHLIQSLVERIQNEGVSFGAIADERMPFKRPTKGEAIKMGHSVRSAAVLLLLVPYKGFWSVVLMQRPEYPGVHSGQISIPGGEVEPHDQDAIGTALREFEEEMGVALGADNVIAQLTERYIPPSQFAVVPFLGVLEELPVWNLEAEEVADVLVVPVSELLGEQALRSTPIKMRDGTRVNLPAYHFNEHVIWGATAIMLAEFAAAWMASFSDAMGAVRCASR